MHISACDMTLLLNSCQWFPVGFKPGHQNCLAQNYADIKMLLKWDPGLPASTAPNPHKPLQYLSSMQPVVGQTY